MSFLKQTLKNTASILLAIGIIGTAYAAITTVNSGDPLTANAWNEIVNKITNTDTNSTDLVTKAYVDNTVSAGGGGGNFSNCEGIVMNNVGSTDQTITCPLGKTIRSHSYTCVNQDNATAICNVTSLTDISLTGRGNSNPGNGYRAYLTASILCCDN